MPLGNHPDLRTSAAPRAGDRVAFGAEQMQGVGFLIAVLEQPGNPDFAVGAVAVLDYPQMLTLPLDQLRVIEVGALVRQIISPLQISQPFLG